jgi:hypothetical protein
MVEHARWKSVSADDDRFLGMWRKSEAAGEDVFQQMEFVPASFQVIRHVCPKLARGYGDAIAQAPAPSRPIERARRQ